MLVELKNIMLQMGLAIANLVELMVKKTICLLFLLRSTRLSNEPEETWNLKFKNREFSIDKYKIVKKIYL